MSAYGKWELSAKTGAAYLVEILGQEGDGSILGGRDGVVLEALVFVGYPIVDTNDALACRGLAAKEGEPLRELGRGDGFNEMFLEPGLDARSGRFLLLEFDLSFLLLSCCHITEAGDPLALRFPLHQINPMTSYLCNLSTFYQFSQLDLPATRPK